MTMQWRLSISSLWIITDGQEYNNDLLYVNNPRTRRQSRTGGLAAVTYDGQSVLTISDDHDDDHPDDHDDIIPEWNTNSVQALWGWINI